MIEPGTNELTLATRCHRMQTFAGGTSVVIHRHGPFPSFSSIGRAEHKQIAVFVTDYGNANRIAAYGDARPPPHAKCETMDGGQPGRLRKALAAIVGPRIADASLGRGILGAKSNMN